MSLYFIITRRYDADGRYRTRYYIECVDGRPRAGDRADASRFTATEVGAIVEQLRTVAPSQGFAILGDDKPPPRAWDGPGPVKRAEQADAFEEGTP